MDAVSIELRMDKRQLAALKQALAEDGTTVESHAGSPQRAL